MKCQHPEIEQLSHAIDLLDGQRLWLCDRCYKHLEARFVSYAVRDVTEGYRFKDLAREFFNTAFQAKAGEPF